MLSLQQEEQAREITRTLRHPPLLQAGPALLKPNRHARENDRSAIDFSEFSQLNFGIPFV
jgi:hypothetical protein